MADEIQFRRGTAYAWALSDEVLAPGEPGVDITNNVLKIGNGRDRWSALPASSGGGPNGPITTGNIADASGLGRSLMTAPDAPTARTILGAAEDDIPTLSLLFKNRLV